MNSKIREIDRVELYVSAEEVHFIAYAATREIERIQGKGLAREKVAREATNLLQELSMKLRAMEVAP